MPLPSEPHGRSKLSQSLPALPLGRATVLPFLARSASTEPRRDRTPPPLQHSSLRLPQIGRPSVSSTPEPSRISASHLLSPSPSSISKRSKQRAHQDAEQRARLQTKAMLAFRSGQSATKADDMTPGRVGVPEMPQDSADQPPREFGVTSPVVGGQGPSVDAHGEPVPQRADHMATWREVLPRRRAKRSPSPTQSPRSATVVSDRIGSERSTAHSDLSLAAAVASRTGVELSRRDKRILRSLTLLRAEREVYTGLSTAVAPQPLGNDEDTVDLSSSDEENSSASADTFRSSSDEDRDATDMQSTSPADRLIRRQKQEEQRRLRPIRHKYRRLHQLLKLRYRALRSVDRPALHSSADAGDARLVAWSWDATQTQSQQRTRVHSPASSRLLRINGSEDEPRLKHVWAVPSDREDDFDAIIVGSAMRSVARTLEALGAVKWRNHGARTKPLDLNLGEGIESAASMALDTATPTHMTQRSVSGFRGARSKHVNDSRWNIVFEQMKKRRKSSGFSIDVDNLSIGSNEDTPHANAGHSKSLAFYGAESESAVYSRAEDAIMQHLLRRASAKFDRKAAKGRELSANKMGPGGSGKRPVSPDSDSVVTPVKTRSKALVRFVTKDGIGGGTTSGGDEAGRSFERKVTAKLGELLQRHRQSKVTANPASKTFDASSEARKQEYGIESSGSDNDASAAQLSDDDSDDSVSYAGSTEDATKSGSLQISAKKAGRVPYRKTGAKMQLPIVSSVDRQRLGYAFNGAPENRILGVNGRHVLASVGAYLDCESFPVTNVMESFDAALFPVASVAAPPAPRPGRVVSPTAASAPDSTLRVKPPQFLSVIEAARNQLLSPARKMQAALATLTSAAAAASDVAPSSPLHTSALPLSPSPGHPTVASPTKSDGRQGADAATAAPPSPLVPTAALAPPLQSTAVKIAEANQADYPTTDTGASPPVNIANEVAKSSHQQQPNARIQRRRAPPTTGVGATSHTDSSDPISKASLTPSIAKNAAAVHQPAAAGTIDIARSTAAKGSSTTQTGDAATKQSSLTLSASKKVVRLSSETSATASTDHNVATATPVLPAGQSNAKTAKVKTGASAAPQNEEAPVSPPKPEGEQFSGATAADVWKRVYLARGSPCLRALQGAPPDPRVKATGPKLRAVVAAITDFKDERILPCPTAERDAEAVATMFELFGYHVTRQFGKGIAVTKDTIVHAVKAAVAECGTADNSLCAIYVAGRGTEGTLHGLDGGQKHYILHHDTKLSAISRHSVLVLEELAELRTANVHPIVYAEIHPLNIVLKGVDPVSVGCGFAVVRSTVQSQCLTFRYPARAAGVFTWYLLKGLQGDAVRSGRLTPGLINAYVYSALLDKLRPSKLGEMDGVIISQQVRADGVHEIVSKNNQMFKFRAQLAERKVRSVSIPCRFMVEALVNVAYLEDVEGYKRTFVQHAHTLFYPPGKWYSSGPKCKLESFSRSGQFHLYMDPRGIADALGTVVREGSIDEDVQQLTGAVFSVQLAEQQEHERQVKREEKFRQLTAQWNDLQKRQQEVAAMQRSGSLSNIAKKGSIVVKAKGGKPSTDAITSPLQSQPSFGAFAFLDTPSRYHAKMSWRTDYSPAVACYHFAPKYRLIHSMSLLLVSTTYPAKFDAEGEPHEVFEDDTLHNSMATIAMASEFGRQRGQFEGRTEVSAADRRRAAVPAHGKALEGIRFNAFAGAQSTPKPAPEGAAESTNDEPRHGGVTLYQPTHAWTPETREISGRTVSHNSIVPSALFDEYYVKNTQRVAGMQIQRAQEKVFLTFAGCERDFLQTMKHGRLGSFAAIKQLHLCTVLRVEYIAGDPAVHRGLAKLQALMRGRYQRRILSLRMALARGALSTAAVTEADWLQKLQAMKAMEVVAARATMVASEEHVREHQWAMQHSLRCEIISQRMRVLSSIEERWFRSTTVQPAEAIERQFLGEQVMRHGLYTRAVVYSRTTMALGITQHQEYEARRRSTNIEESDRAKLRMLQQHEWSRLK
jgi:hypothetical protein